MKAEEPAKRPTIRDVATVAGVSSGTVSRVLNGKNWVSPESKAAVDAAIKKTGYRINPHARNLATSRSNTIAFLLTEQQHLLFDDPNFSVLVRGAATALAAKDLSLVLIIAGDPDERARATKYLAGGHVDGVLLLFSSPTGNPLVESLIDMRIPLVACGQPLGFEGQLGCVSADDFNGARRMTKYLLEQGRSTVTTITGPQDTPGGLDRLRGFRDVMGPTLDESRISYGDYSRASGYRAMKELLERTPDLDAVFAGNDIMAAGAIDALRDAGKRVPEDVAVGGFDDSVVATASHPTITTMHQPFDRISSEMVRVLLEIIAGEAPSTVTLPTSLIQRESA